MKLPIEEENDEQDVYESSEDMLDEDELSIGEAGFMRGYNEAA